MKKSVLIIILSVLLFFGCFYGCQKDSVQTFDDLNPAASSDATDSKKTSLTEIANESEATEKRADEGSKLSHTESVGTDDETDEDERNAVYPLTTRTVDFEFEFNYSVKKDDMLLEVYAPKKISQYNDFYIVARITNCSDKVVEYSIPVTDNLHKEIVVEIKDENGQKFTDRDTFGLLYDAGMKTVSLEPGEVFNETICFIPGAAKNDFLNPGIENADITYFDEGIYNGIASFSWQTEDESDHSVSVEFTVEIE